MGNEWGRSLDLKDAASGAQIWGYFWLLLTVQGWPVPIVLCYLLFADGVTRNLKAILDRGLS